MPEAAEDSFDISFPTKDGVSDEDGDNSDMSDIVSEKESKEANNVKRDLFRLNYMLNLGAATWFDKGV